MNTLKENLNEAKMQEYLFANGYVTKNTLNTRVLQKAMRVLDISQNDLNMMLNGKYINPQVSTYLSQHIPYNYPTFSPWEKDFVYRIYSKDFHDAHELATFAGILESKLHDPEIRLHLYIAFGYDGYYGDPIIRYVGNLRFSMREDADGYFDQETKGLDNDTVARVVHLRAVRYLYEKLGSPSVEELNAIIQDAFHGVTEDKAKNYRMTQKYIASVGSYFKDIKVLYEVDNIAEL